jgi:hypothetical protein
MWLAWFKKYISGGQRYNLQFYIPVSCRLKNCNNNLTTGYRMKAGAKNQPVYGEWLHFSVVKSFFRQLILLPLMSVHKNR